MGRCHGHQALDSGEGYCAALGGAHQAAADAVLAVILCQRGEDTVGAEALRGHGHAVCEVRKDGLSSGIIHFGSIRALDYVSFINMCILNSPAFFIFNAVITHPYYTVGVQKRVQVNSARVEGIKFNLDVFCH